MASIEKYIVDGYECNRLTDTSFGRRLQYAIKLDKFTAKQWLTAHNEVMLSLSPEDRQNITSKSLKEAVLAWFNTTKEGKANAKQTGIKLQAIEAKGEANINKVAERYLLDFCQAGINSKNAMARARRQCEHLREFFAQKRIILYSQIKREHIAEYLSWRTNSRFDGRAGTASADTINHELYRLASIIKHGVKFCGWQERYLLDGVRVKATPQNTKAVRPFEITEIKTILEWLRTYSERINDWHLHDMILLALCSGLEAKALNLLAKDWFKIDLGILRVYDKLVSGVIDAKTQNRARDIPLTPTLRKLYDMGNIFHRNIRTHRKSEKGGTAFAAWAESILNKAEQETGIADINLHRFRHTCATARLSAGWQLIRVSRMLGHSNVNTTASHYAEYDLSASPAGFEGMLAAYGEFVRWLDEGYFA
jgi:integrase